MPLPPGAIYIVQTREVTRKKKPTRPTDPTALLEVFVDNSTFVYKQVGYVVEHILRISRVHVSCARLDTCPMGFYGKQGGLACFLQFSTFDKTPCCLIC